MEDGGKGFNVVFAVILAWGADTGIAVGGRADHCPITSGRDWAHNPLPVPDTTEIPGAACFCDRFGCMETCVSDHTVEGQYALYTGQKPKAWATMELKRNADMLAGNLWDRSIGRVPRRLAAVVNMQDPDMQDPDMLDPDVFFMGSSMSNVDELYQDLAPALAKRTLSTVFHTLILRDVNGDANGVRGAASLWKN